MILFLNKMDIFRRKIRYSPVSAYFPDYTGKTHVFEIASDVCLMYKKAQRRTATAQLIISEGALRS